MNNRYLFSSQRLGFRNWVDSDVEKMAKISGDPVVMEFFPSTQSFVHTSGFVDRMKRQYDEVGFCYFAVETIIDSEFIGFLGLSNVTFDADFTPCVDIGWRFDKRIWNQGYATEGGQRCLSYGFETLNLDEIYSIASVVNVKSERIMKKIGMQKVNHFVHPSLSEYPMIEDCMLYRINKDTHVANRQR